MSKREQPNSPQNFSQHVCKLTFHLPNRPGKQNSEDSKPPRSWFMKTEASSWKTPGRDWQRVSFCLRYWSLVFQIFCFSHFFPHNKKMKRLIDLIVVSGCVSTQCAKMKKRPRKEVRLLPVTRIQNQSHYMYSNQILWWPLVQSSPKCMTKGKNL